MLEGLLLLLVLLPALGALGAGRARMPRMARRVALTAAALTALVAMVLAAHAVLGGGAVSQLVSPIGGLVVLRADGAAAVLSAVSALVTLGALLTSAPRALDGATARSVLVGHAGTLMALCAGMPWVLVVGACLSTSPLWSGRAGPVTAALARGVAVLCTLLLVLALLPDTLLPAGAPARTWLAPWCSAALVLSVMIRAGVPPFQAWVPVALHRAPVLLAVPVLVSPLPMLVLARHVAALGADPGWLGVALVGVGTAGAVIAALLAMVQHDLRRMLGYMQVGATCLMMAALGPATEPGLAGAVFAAGSASLALACLAYLVEAVVSRTGTADMRELGGLHPALPVGGAVFLVASLALVGFPGTSGFVAEDLLMQALVPGYPVVAVVLLVVVALNGVTLYRSYSRTFLGPRSADRGVPERLLPRERALAVGLAAALVLGGVAPLPLIAVRAALEAPDDGGAGP